jgi:DNA polymerase-3 subunit alpha
MDHADFVHLHNHSDYSLLDGASPIPAMVERAAQLRMPALALTDHGALFGAIEFYEAARKAGVKPIVGMEAYVTRHGRAFRGRESNHHLVLLARDETGLRNLMRLSSIAYLEGFYYKPRMDHEVLARYSQGLLALSACLKGEVATDLLAGDEEGALRTAQTYRDIFGAENYFLEIQNHGLPAEEEARRKVEALSRRSGIPLVATNDCHYLRHEDADAHDVLLCIQTGKTVDERDRMRYEADQFFMRSAEEMRQVFPDLPEALRNTLVVAERCNLQINFGKPLLPEFPLPEGESSAEDYLRRMVHAELPRRLADAGPDARRRADYELEVICRMGFAPYFLIVRDFIDFARRNGIGVGPGRGSVAGSLVAYVLRITDIDPLRHGLIFERFLNPERVSMPDIDIDFDDLRRGEVIEYVKQRYGTENVTQIITFGTMGAKGVVRDVGRALGVAYSEVDRIAKLVPDGIGMTLARALELSPDLRNLPQRSPQMARLLQSARTLEGLTRHASIHAAGVLITPGPLTDYVPLYRQNKGEITTQWDMKSVEKAGLLKMDFLGLRTLSVLAEAVRLVRERHRVELDLQELPMDDEPSYRVFQEAETVAIFQFESSGMRDYLKKLKPTVFEDLVAMNALYRPGPMENIPYFIDCKHGRAVAKFEHPDLEPILKGTYGVFVYQEQVMAAAHALAGFSLAEADELRRAMGKKRPEEMEAKRKAFVDGCKANKIAAGKAEKIFATMEKFAGYGFNKCVVGGTEILEARTGERTTVEELYRNRRAFSVHAMDPDGRLRGRPVTDVVWNGRKHVFRLATGLGKAIIATANHRIRAFDGWTPLGRLRAGDRIAVAQELAVGGEGGCARTTGDTSFEPGMIVQGSLALSVQEAPVRSGEFDLHWDRVVSIEPAGIHDTYDLTVHQDHNFVANGIVVHNSHSAAYALLAYQSAYLKANYPAEFMTATLTSEMWDSARIVTLVEECRRLGLAVLPPDVNRSGWKFAIEESGLRWGLGAVRNVGQGAAESLVAARAEGGAFRDLHDLVSRLDSRAANRRVVESLIAAGACDALGGHRAQLTAAVPGFLERAAGAARERAAGQASLFEGENGTAVEVRSLALPDLPPFSASEQGAREREVLGFYFTEHPLERVRDQAARVATARLAELAERGDGAEVRVVALVTEVKTVQDRNRRRMAFVTLEDQSARVECLVFADLFEQAAALLEKDRMVCAAGRVSTREETEPKLVLSEVKSLDEAVREARRALHLELRAEGLNEERLERIDELLSRFPGDCEVYLHIVKPDQSRLAMRSKRLQVAEDEAVLAGLREALPEARAYWGKRP